MFPTRPEDMLPPPLPIPLPRASVYYQTVICDCGTKRHPYWVGFHQSPHQVSEGVGCHQRDCGRRMVARGFPKGNLLAAVESHAGDPIQPG